MTQAREPRNFRSHSDTPICWPRWVITNYAAAQTSKTDLVWLSLNLSLSLVLSEFDVFGPIDCLRILLHAPYREKHHTERSKHQANKQQHVPISCVRGWTESIFISDSCYMYLCNYLDPYANNLCNVILSVTLFSTVSFHPLLFFISLCTPQFGTIWRFTPKNTIPPLPDGMRWLLRKDIWTIVMDKKVGITQQV